MAQDPAFHIKILRKVVNPRGRRSCPADELRASSEHPAGELCRWRREPEGSFQRSHTNASEQAGCQSAARLPTCPSGQSAYLGTVIGDLLSNFVLSPRANGQRSPPVGHPAAIFCTHSNLPA